MKYKVAFIITSLNLGGAELRLLDVVRYLDRSRFEPLLFIAKGGGELMSQLNDEQVYIGFTQAGKVWRGLPALVTMLRREKPDVIWCLQSSLTSFVGRLFAWLLGVPVVILSIHGRFHGRAIIDWPNRLLTRWTTDRVVILSEIYREWLTAEGIPEHLITIQYNGVDTERFSPAAGQYKTKVLGVDGARPVIGIVGNLHQRKAHEVLIRAASRIVKQLPDVLFVIVGEGEQHSLLEQLRDELGLSENVRLLGARTDVPDLMRTFDVFCLTSDFGEGCSNATLEALATGLPVVTTDFGGASELVDDEVGIVVPRRDDVALADAIVRLLNDPQRRLTMGQAARQRAVEHFSLQKMIQARESLLLELLEKA